MSFLKPINASSEEGTKPVKKLQDLVVNHPYKIVKAKLIKTVYGKSVLLDLEEQVVFLPKRVTESIQGHITELSSIIYIIKYSVTFTGQEAIPGKPNSHQKNLFRIDEIEEK